ncbi:helix-turn-helix transcriptional regulator [uncultured Desulfovibrio sp.]|uniref:helix-turn-helix domain-containing protein n=1 Tax=uncultured Desulfovibrio sp. TaxID=167968 RepID=UPI0026244137|nr:helix-turn-helix transcriptional regulator [uncultured Desulfovibrio sp.]
MQKLGERIRHVRGRISQEAFAGLLGISKGALGGYERGENCPNADVILTICNKCKINVSWLMSGAGTMHAPDNIDEDERPENRPAPLEDGSQTAGELSCQMAPGQDCKAENNALRAHCRWLQERRDLNRENRLLWQKNAGLGERLARLEQSQEMARVNDRASEEDTTAALTVSRHGVRCNRLQESCKTDRT